MMSGHINKIMKLLNKDHDVDKHIQNISSYKLSFFQKLVLCRGLKFSFPQRISPMDIQASFEKAFWQLEPSLSDDKKELAAATLRSIALTSAIVSSYFCCPTSKIMIQYKASQFRSNPSLTVPFFFFCSGFCKNPGSFDNGKVTGNDYSYNSSVRFQCNFDYDLLGATVLTCKKGKWNGTIPVCKSK